MDVSQRWSEKARYKRMFSIMSFAKFKTANQSSGSGVTGKRHKVSSLSFEFLTSRLV